MTKYAAQYQYVVDGKTYTVRGDLGTYQPTAVPVTEATTVRYLPGHPEKAEADDRDHRDAVAGTLNPTPKVLTGDECTRRGDDGQVDAMNPYDPPTADTLNVVAYEWTAQLTASAASRPAFHPLLELGDTVPPHVDEFDVGYKAVDTWHGGNPGPALDVVRQALLDASAITRLRPSAIGALERRDIRWAVHHGSAIPKPLSDHRLWEVADAATFEETISRFLRRPTPLPADVRDRITVWAARPETNAGAPERGGVLDDFLTNGRSILRSDQVSTETRSGFLRWYIDAYKGMYTADAEQLWRWLNAQGALRKPNRDERATLGDLPDGLRVWDRSRLTDALPELTREP